MAIRGLVTLFRTPNQEELARLSSLLLKELSAPMTLAYSLASAWGFLPSSMNFMATATVVGR